MCRLSLVKLVAADIAAAAAAEAAGAALEEALAPLPRGYRRHLRGKRRARPRRPADVHAVREEAAENAAETAKGASYAVAMQYMEVAIATGRALLTNITSFRARGGGDRSSSGHPRVGAGLALPRPPTLYVATSELYAAQRAPYETRTAPFRARGGAYWRRGRLIPAVPWPWPRLGHHGLPRVHGALEPTQRVALRSAGLTGRLCLLQALSVDVTVARIDAEVRAMAPAIALQVHTIAPVAPPLRWASHSVVPRPPISTAANAALSIFPDCRAAADSPSVWGKRPASTRARSSAAHTTNSTPSRQSAEGTTAAGLATGQ